MAPSLHQPVTLHETSPLVLVDVDVTDKHGIPIHGFTVNDFHVFEGGSEQQIGSFEEHRGVAASPAVITASLPPDTYTNQCLSSPGSPLFVILLDSLNTAMSDQALLTSNVEACAESASRIAGCSIPARVEADDAAGLQRGHRQADRNAQEQ
jgi:hypothetical protein